MIKINDENFQIYSNIVLFTVHSVNVMSVLIGTESYYDCMYWLKLLFCNYRTYFLEFSPPLNCSRTIYLAQAEQNESCPQIVPVPCVCMIILVGVAQHSTVQSYK